MAIKPVSIRHRRLSDIQGSFGLQGFSSMVPGISTTILLGPPGLGVATREALADHAYILPIYVPQPMTFDALVCHVTTAGFAGTLSRMGLYGSALSGVLSQVPRPSALLVDGGTVAADSVGLKTLVITPIALNEGLYWTVLVAQNAAVPLPVFAGIDPAAGSFNVQSNLKSSTSFVGDGNLVAFGSIGVAGALPNPVGTLTASSFAPLIALRRSA